MAKKCESDSDMVKARAVGGKGKIPPQFLKRGKKMGRKRESRGRGLARVQAEALAEENEV